ncbi:lipocalin family protein [Deinococcus aquiradiocola]|uniref:AttH domain-containing protein n=1 Tax=Deinococcus aquiradiocola TaxID=393059 RepID=A0A917PFL0_9DEIO|nr:lipocalin family protein [Deinococcus aquiradiocola]GGJ73949.1 hypothetical protein GCM10008939_17800 [Deinococcus aquiradiocola]
MRARILLASLMCVPVLTACLPRAERFDGARVPEASALGPNRAATEWWYVSAYLPDTGQAFHWAQFKVNYQGVPYNVAHVAVTDLNTGQVQFLENRAPGATFTFPPLRVRQGDWSLTQEGAGNTAGFRLVAGPLDVTLTPQKGPVVHPPGYSGTPETGQLYYQSVTRLSVGGTVAGRAARGTAWLDHQWGDQQPGRTALWDWFGVHLSDGSDLMLYRVRTPDGRVVQLAGSEVGADGVARAVGNVSMTPARTWVSGSGRTYVLDWTVRSDRGELTLRAVNDTQELLARSTFVAYWEGPVRGEGRWGGNSVTVDGMGEFVGGPLSGAELSRTP